MKVASASWIDRDRAARQAWLGLLAASLLGLSLAAATAQSPAVGPARWWRGNLHTHTLWSDGTDYPEMVVDWYKTNGYHFLALSDHNALQQGTKWLTVGTEKGEQLVQRYVQRFGGRWVEQQLAADYHKVRLKTLPEFRRLFEQPGRFLLIQSEEITDYVTNELGKAHVHVNATNLRTLIQPPGGHNVLDMLQRAVNAVLAQRHWTGQPMFPHVAHPNFGWSLTAEDLMQVQGERFFEVYNGHPAVHNQGDGLHPGTDRLWDIALTFRLAQLRLGPLFGLAVDDAHQFHNYSRSNSNPGRGWVMVRAPHLTADGIVRALEAGDFYASTGVKLRDVQRGARQLSLMIEPEPGITYTTQFIGTRWGFDPASEPSPPPPGGGLPVSRRYREDIGLVLAEVTGTTPSYTVRGNEIYVRAKVISSKTKAGAVSAREKEMAWVQPLIPAAR